MFQLAALTAHSVQPAALSHALHRSHPSHACARPAVLVGGLSRSQHARGSAATDSPSACAISSANARCAATEMRCVANGINLRAAHVVSSYSDEVMIYR